jgi:GT2 family glycosyltransferase
MLIGIDEASVYCVIVNWNGWRDTLKCLGSLEDSNYRNFTIMVVDNGSHDDSVARIKEAYPTVHILETGANLGFARGNNEGIRLALAHNPKYIWLLNNDTTVARETLSALVATAEMDSEIGEVGSVLYYMNAPDQIQAWGGGAVNLWFGRSSHFRGEVPASKLDYLTAASVLIPSRVLREVGLFDEGYFMYWEDTDLSYRIRAAGWRLVVASGGIVLHKESASSKGHSSKLDRYMSASGIRFLKRYARVPGISIALMIAGRALKRLLWFRWMNAWALFAGLSGYGND